MAFDHSDVEADAVVLDAAELARKQFALHRLDRMLPLAHKLFERQGSLRALRRRQRFQVARSLTNLAIRDLLGALAAFDAENDA